MSVKKYAILGAHSSGKSTFAMRLAYHLRAASYNVDIVQERVRYSPFPFNENATIETAMWLYHKQICRELESQSRGFTHVICDRAIIDCVIYANYRHINSAYFEQLKSCAEEWMLTYDKIFFLRPDIPIAQDGIRSPDEKFRKEIDMLFEIYIKKLRSSLNGPCPKIIELQSSEIIKSEFNYDWIA